jgi:site-specific DNA recombinase
LRGLIRCCICGGTYTGAAQVGSRRYGFHGGTKNAQTFPEQRCYGKQIPADWLEAAVWEECRQFILNPGEALDEARKRLRQRMATSTTFEARRRSTLAALAEKETERERTLTAYRKS